jgi:FkbM family methyltransferase
MNSFKKLIWRLGRRIYLYARGDIGSPPEINGEFSVLDTIISGLSVAECKSKLTFFDIGSNKGAWIDEVLRLCKGQNPKIFSIEPARSTYTSLLGKYDDNVGVFNIALGAKQGISDLYIYGEQIGINSLHHFIDSAVLNLEAVKVERFDDFCSENKVTDVLYVKSDTEGNCLNILFGADASLSAGAIQFWQFEYNHRWLYAESSLFKLFKYIEDKPYKVSKLTGGKVIVYEKWHFELDRFFEGNYLLIRNDCVEALSSIIEYHNFDEFNVTQKCH